MKKYQNRMAAMLITVAALAGSANGQLWGEFEGQPETWRNPISNPVYNDVAMIKREVRLVYIWNAFPGHIDTLAGDLPVGGDLNAFAVQFELPITSNLSIVANKSGVVDVNPDSTLNEQEGWNDLAAGLKWAFWQQDCYTAALRATVEFPIGDDDVFQSNGDGHISPALLVTYCTDRVTVNTIIGATLPFNEDEESTVGYLSLGGAYRFTDRLSGHLELNWFRVLEEGDGEADFDGQLAALVPNISEFEGGDLVNFGAVNGERHPNFVSLAIGARYQLTERLGIGVAAEMPLTSEERGLMDERITANLTFKF
jgi:hypothetical protein